MSRCIRQRSDSLHRPHNRNRVMNADRNVFQWAIPFGSWLGIRVRVSIWFFLIAVALCWRLDDVPLALTYSVILFFSVLFHEFGHIMAARRTGGSGDEVHITPIGGLAMCVPAPNFASRFLTVAGGPLVNLAACLITLIPIWGTALGEGWYNPLTLPPIELTSKPLLSIVPELLLLVLKANWLLLLINLIPVHPLDGGRMLHLSLMSRLEAPIAHGVYLRIGAFFGVAFIVAGLASNNVWVMVIGAVVLPLNMYEDFRSQVAEREGSESFLGYDFSEGYTSLERSAPEDTNQHQPGVIERWKQQRDEDRQRKLDAEEREMERTLDMLLEKLHTQGENSLTPGERKQLQQISARIRDRKSGR